MSENTEYERYVGFNEFFAAMEFKEATNYSRFICNCKILEKIASAFCLGFPQIAKTDFTDTGAKVCRVYSSSTTEKKPLHTKISQFILFLY